MSESYAPVMCPYDLEPLAYLEQNNLLYSSISITALIETMKNVSCQLASYSSDPCVTSQTLLTVILNAVHALGQFIDPSVFTPHASQTPTSISTTHSQTKSITYTPSPSNPKSITHSVTNSTTKTITYSTPSSNSTSNEISHSVTHSVTQITSPHSNSTPIHSITHSTSKHTKTTTSSTSTCPPCPKCPTTVDASKVIDDLHNVIYAFINVSQSMQQTMTHELNILKDNITTLNELNSGTTKQQYESIIEKLKTSLQNLYTDTSQTSQSLLKINENQIQQLADDVSKLVAINS